MVILEKQKEFLEMLARNEEKVSELYQIYAVKFPAYLEFWSGLAKEELGHAAWIRMLKDSEEALFNEGRMKSNIVEISLKYLDDQILEAKTKDMTLSEALSIAIELETNLIERKFFAVFKGDSVELEEIFNNLETATHSHVERARNLWLEKVINNK